MDIFFENDVTFDQRFKVYFNQYFKRLYLYALSFTSVETEAEDIVQDVFIRFWESGHYKTLKDPAVKVYLFNSIRNACIDKQEKRDVLRGYVDLLNMDVAEEEIFAIDEKLIEEIRQAIEQMSPQTRKILVSVFFKRMKYQEVAYELSISQNSVKTLLKNGMKRLREQFADRFILFLVYYLSRGEKQERKTNREINNFIREISEM